MIEDMEVKVGSKEVKVEIRVLNLSKKVLTQLPALLDLNSERIENLRPICWIQGEAIGESGRLVLAEMDGDLYLVPIGPYQRRVFKLKGQVVWFKGEAIRFAVVK